MAIELSDRLVSKRCLSSTKRFGSIPKGTYIKLAPGDIARCPFWYSYSSQPGNDPDPRRHYLPDARLVLFFGRPIGAPPRRSWEKINKGHNLLDFMLQIGPRTRNLILGTGNPIQTEVYDSGI